MPLLTPDPTFYPSPTLATQAPPEKLAYLALINPHKNGRPDALGVVDSMVVPFVMSAPAMLSAAGHEHV